MLSFPTDRQDFKALEGVEIFQKLRANKPDIVKEFAKAINADTKIVHKFDDDMIARLENELIRLGFVSATNNQEFFYDENLGWRSSPVSKEYYLIQPAIKYYHLKKALEFVETNEYYNSLSEAGKQFVMDKLDSKIKGDMTEQIVVYETSKALPSDKFFVCKVSFADSDPSKSKGEYDMLIYDKVANSYFAFEIKHTSQAYSGQRNHLLNKKFREIIDYKYGDKENVSVLYNGNPFADTSGVIYLNISDFVKEIARCKDARTAIQNLCSDLPLRNLEAEEMDIQTLKRTSPSALRQSVMLAKQARLEKVKHGQITTVCPKCRKNPNITTTAKGERTIVSCDCGFIYSEEINF